MKTVLACREIEIILSAHLEGEATASQWHEAEQHLAECGACTKLWQNFQASTATFKTNLIRHEPSAELWDKIATRLEAEPQPTWPERLRELWEEFMNWMRVNPSRAALGFGFAVALFLLFSLPFLRRLASPQLPLSETIDSTATVDARLKPSRPYFESSKNDPLRRARLAAQISDYFEATRFVLLEVKNTDAESEALDVTEVKQSSQKLLEQTLLLKADLKGEQLQTLQGTIDQLEVVLFDLANMEDNPAPEEMDVLRATILQKNLLIKIEITDLEALTRKAEDRPALQTPSRRATKPRI